MSIASPVERASFGAPASAVGQTWRDRRACRTADPEIFFVDPTGWPSMPARRLCAVCPVRRECLDFAMRIEPAQSRHGIWGGISPSGRETLAKGRAPAHGTLDRAVDCDCDTCHEAWEVTAWRGRLYE